MRARVPAASVMADGTLIISESAREIYTFTSCIREYTYARSCSERVRAFPVASAIADSTLSTTKSARKIYAFTFNIRGRIYMRGGSERVRAFRPLQRWLTAP